VANGSGQKAAPNTPVTESLAVYVVDSAGSAVQGASVAFSAPASGASGTFAESGGITTAVLTDGAGIAQASTFTANSELGAYAVQTTVDGLAGTRSIMLTNTAIYVSPSGIDSIGRMPDSVQTRVPRGKQDGCT
jgi:hypothetical protein